MGFHPVGQGGLELPTSGDLPALASKVLGLQAWASMPGHYIPFLLYTFKEDFQYYVIPKTFDFPKW